MWLLIYQDIQIIFQPSGSFLLLITESSNFSILRTIMMQITKSKAIILKQFQTFIFPNADMLILVLASVDLSLGQEYCSPPLHQYMCKCTINNAFDFSHITLDYPYDCTVFLSHSYCAVLDPGLTSLPRDLCINCRGSLQNHKLHTGNWNLSKNSKNGVPNSKCTSRALSQWCCKGPRRKSGMWRTVEDTGTFNLEKTLTKTTQQ